MLCFLQDPSTHSTQPHARQAAGCTPRQAGSWAPHTQAGSRAPHPGRQAAGHHTTRQAAGHHTQSGSRVHTQAGSRAPHNQAGSRAPPRQAAGTTQPGRQQGTTQAGSRHHTTRQAHSRVHTQAGSRVYTQAGSRAPPRQAAGCTPRQAGSTLGHRSRSRTHACPHLSMVAVGKAAMSASSPLALVDMRLLGCATSAPMSLTWIKRSMPPCLAASLWVVRGGEGHVALNAAVLGSHPVGGKGGGGACSNTQHSSSWQQTSVCVWGGGADQCACAGEQTSVRVRGRFNGIIVGGQGLVMQSLHKVPPRCTGTQGNVPCECVCVCVCVCARARINAGGAHARRCICIMHAY